MPVVLARDVRRLVGGRVLLGGDPGRLVRLRPAGVSELLRLERGEQVGAPARRLARTLVDGGLAHPRPGCAPVVDVTVVIPVKDRTAELDRALAALGRVVPVVVVDDGSRDAAAVAAVCDRHGVQRLRLPCGQGPAAARNAGLAGTDRAFVAFVDSDCVPPPGWLAALVGHFEDDRVGAVAPRIGSGPVGPAGGVDTVLARYRRSRGPLDMGDREGLVRPGSRVPYVPSAALVVRRSALSGSPQQPFDPGLRFGEDVDLVWRLHDAGWQVRYDPRTVVVHQDPEHWYAWLERRYRYGTSAAPLARRHGSRLTPLVLPPWPAAALLLLAAGRPLTALAAATVPAARLHLLLRRTGLPTRTCLQVAVSVGARAVLGTGRGLGGAGLVATGPPLLVLLFMRRTRRVATVALLGPPAFAWLAQRPRLDPLRWVALRVLDDLAYACGVWRGCWLGRTTVPLRPRWSRPR